MEIDPILIVLQLIPFLFVLVGLHFIIFKPMLHLLEEREKNIVKDREVAALEEARVKDQMDELEQKLSRAKAKANEERQALREEIRKGEQEILDRARAQGDVLVTEARSQIETERKAASRALREETDALANEIASSVLGRSV